MTPRRNSESALPTSISAVDIPRARRTRFIEAISALLARYFEAADVGCDAALPSLRIGPPDRHDDRPEPEPRGVVLGNLSTAAVDAAAGPVGLERVGRIVVLPWRQLCRAERHAAKLLELLQGQGRRCAGRVGALLGAHERDR